MKRVASLSLASLSLASLSLASLLVVGACGGGDDPASTDVDSQSPLAIFVTPDKKAVVDAYVAGLQRTDVGVGTSDDPVKLMQKGGSAVRVALVADLDCGECWRVDGAGAGRAVVHGGNALGLQYGLSEVLEGMGFRFFHPKKTHAPAKLELGSLPASGTLTKPQQTLRGLQLHTLHPIEAMYDFWMPGDDHLAGAKATLDWMVKNRGNFMHWLTLDNVDDPTEHAAWVKHTKAINDYAHLRGVRTSIGLQLFGTASLQKSWILTKTPSPGFEEDLEPALRPIIDGTGFDHVGLSFGEFSSAPPEALISGINETYAAIQRIKPGMTMSGTIHVGDDLKVNYMGKDLIYYFLVEYARPEVIPWVHTVFYYNLYEDAGGAYNHQDFHEHREYLLSRLKDGRPAAYHPETAYWISFDNSVPMYLPVYMRSRWLDMARIEEDRIAMGGQPLREHVTFSTGWEWGYWQHDAVTLRMGVTIPKTWEEAVAYQFAPYGNDGIAKTIVELAELQHDALIVNRLAPFLAGRDEIIDIGDANLGKIAAPDRPTFDELMKLSDEDLAKHETSVVTKLVAFADGNEKLAKDVEALGLPQDPFLDELRDGFAIDKERSRFVAELHLALIAFRKTASDEGHLALADAALARGLDVIARRHAALHDGRTKDMTERNNEVPTVYKFGYLHQPHSACLWVREKLQLRKLILGEKVTIPGCAL